MYAVTNRAKSYQLAHLSKRPSMMSFVSEATLQYQYLNIHFSLIYALFAESSIDTFKEMCIQHDNV